MLSRSSQPHTETRRKNIILRGALTLGQVVIQTEFPRAVVAGQRFRLVVILVVIIVVCSVEEVGERSEWR